MKWEIIFSKKNIFFNTPPPRNFFDTIFFLNVGNSMKREENMKFWKKKKKIIFFNIKKNHKKFKQHSINIKNYTAHLHHLVHVPAKFRENTAMRLWVTVRKLNVTDGRTDGQTDGRTDGGHCNISRPGPPAPREIKRTHWSPGEHKLNILCDLQTEVECYYLISYIITDRDI